MEEAFHISREKKGAFQIAIPTQWKNCMLNYCYIRLRSERNRLQRKLNCKLNHLMDWTKNTNPSFVMNLSSEQLGKD